MKTIFALSVIAGLFAGLVGLSADDSVAVPARRFVAPVVSPDPIAEKPADGLTQDGRRASEVIEEFRGRYRYLDDVTVRMGTTPKDEQAVAYYTTGEIVISPRHTATIEEILAHEIWHVIDWRDNGRLDWGENLPPTDSYAFQLR